jgi:hypothetical protein
MGFYKVKVMKNKTIKIIIGILTLVAVIIFTGRPI